MFVIVSPIFCLYFLISKVVPDSLDCKHVAIQPQAEEHKNPNPPNSGLSFLGRKKQNLPAKDISNNPLKQPISSCSNYFILNSLALFIIFRKLLPLPLRFIFVR